MALKLKVLTLNCWGVFVPFACQHRRERMLAIALELSKGEYDIAILQEVWTQGDYEKLCDKILPSMPYTHYFHSGTFGSGVCIFSKHVILETFHHRFSLNGYAHMHFHGDWHCGKSIGLAKILFRDLHINVYGTHLHAQYHEPDKYVAHRVAQSFEVSQFVRHTSENCDLIIVGGDFNFRPDQLGYKVIRYSGNLHDSWVARRENLDVEMTCDRPDNPYTPSASLQDHPRGKRLDYIMFRENSGVNVTCEKCYLTMQEVPDQPYHYSDHEGVAAEFTIRKNLTAMSKPREVGEIEKHLIEAQSVIDSGVKKVKSSQVFYAVTSILCIVALVFSSGMDVPYGLGIAVALCRVAVILYLAFCAWMAVTVTNRELTALMATNKDMNNAIKSLAAT